MMPRGQGKEKGRAARAIAVWRRPNGDTLIHYESLELAHIPAGSVKPVWMGKYSTQEVIELAQAWGGYERLGTAWVGTRSAYDGILSDVGGIVLRSESDVAIDDPARLARVRLYERRAERGRSLFDPPISVEELQAEIDRGS